VGHEKLPRTTFDGNIRRDELRHSLAGPPNGPHICAVSFSCPPQCAVSCVPTTVDRLALGLTSRFRIEREVGSGGMATVYVAHDMKHDRDVAVKVLREELGVSLGKERFLREVKVVATLQHPHIVPLYDSGEVDGLLYYMMPYVEGESLRQRLVPGQPLPLDEAVRILRDVADALAEAHRRGVVHRDLKPENVMLRGRHALVMDFGVAKAVSEATGAASLTSVGIALGTPTYMSPEQATADPNTDHRADIYAFGVLAYEMLTGGPPFKGQTPQQTLAAHLNATPEPIDSSRGVPVTLAALVMKCLEKNPDNRCQRVDEVLEEIESIATPSLGLAPASRAAAGGAVAARRRITGVSTSRIIAAVVLGLIVLSGTALAWRNRSGAAGSRPSVAVLTFNSIGADTGASYLAAGLADGITSALGAAPKLTIVSRTAVRGLGERTALAPTQLGERLGASHLVSGSVQRAGGRLLVTIELVLARTGEQLWSKRYDTTAANVLGMPESIAQRIADRLLPASGTEVGKRPTMDAAAYDHYLRGNRLLWNEQESSVLGAIAEYDEALRRDPRFSSAMGRLAYAYGVATNWSYHPGGLSTDSVLERGLAIANAALRTDSSNSDAWLGRALSLFFRGAPDDLTSARTAVRRAVMLDSASDAAHHYSAVINRRTGRFDEAEQDYHRALAINPGRVQSQADLGFIAYSRRAFAVAIEMYQRAVQIDTSVASTYAFLGLSRLGAGDADGAVRALHQCIGLSSANEQRRYQALLAYVEARAGDRSHARADFEQALKAMTGSLTTLPATIGVRDAWELASAATAIGEKKLAIDLLERTRPRGPWLWSYLIFEGFDPLRTDSRFRRIIDEARPPGAVDPEAVSFHR